MITHDAVPAQSNVLEIPAIAVPTNVAFAMTDCK